MKHSLTVVRFNGNGDAATPVKQFAPDYLGVRCSLPGWLQRLEWTERKRNYLATYFAYDKNHGQRVALVDSLGNVIVCGWIYSVQPDGLYNHYVAAGGWKRHSDRLDTTTYAATDTVDTIMTAIVTNYVGGLSSDYSHIVASGAAVGNAFGTNQNYGSRPAELIENLLAISDSSYNIYDYWIQSRALRGTRLYYPFAYCAARSGAATVDWRVHRRDLMNSPQGARDIFDMATRVTVYYRANTLVNNAGGYVAGTTVITVDSGSVFAAGNAISMELSGGDKHYTSVSAVAGNNITINDPLPSAIGDNAKIFNESLTASSTVTNSDAESARWRVDYATEQMNMDSTTAAQYANAYSSTYSVPAARGSFTISASTIRNGTGAEYPTWYLLRRPSYIQVTDLYPAASLMTTSLNSLTSFWTMALDYDGRQMRVVPDGVDNRLDVQLKRAGIVSGEMVYRG